MREAERAWVFTKDDLIDSGLYGAEVTPAARERLGDIVVAARVGVTYYTPEMSPKFRRMVGQHGSLTNEETVVPLIRQGAFAR